MKRNTKPPLTEYNVQVHFRVDKRWFFDQTADPSIVQCAFLGISDERDCFGNAVVQRKLWKQREDLVVDQSERTMLSGDILRKVQNVVVLLSDKQGKVGLQRSLAVELFAHVFQGKNGLARRISFNGILRAIPEVQEALREIVFLELVVPVELRFQKFTSQILTRNDSSRFSGESDVEQAVWTPWWIHCIDPHVRSRSLVRLNERRIAVKRRVLRFI